MKLKAATTASFSAFLLLPLSLLSLSCKSEQQQAEQRTTKGSASDTAQGKLPAAEQRVTEGSASAVQQSGLAGKKPNIIFVLTDDQGMGDLSCMGNPFLQTPHIDAFYAKSSRFSDFHVSPTCSPTRAALMSGRHPLEVGVSHTVRYRERLAKDVITMPRALQQAGYRTGIFGKWHLGDEEDYLPQKRGFHEVLIHPAGGLCQYVWGDFKPNVEAKYFDNVLLHNETIVQTRGYCTDLFFDAGLAWTKKQLDAGQPFFTYISLNAPHSPMYAPEKNIQRFMDAGFEDRKVAARYAMVENIDENFGKLMGYLEQWNALENTLVIFMTDNGMAMGGFQVKGKKHEAHNAGMKGKKNSPDEGGTRVPSFWYWKGKTAEGVDIPALTRHLDLYRTFCELAGVPVPESTMPPRGRSLVPLLENPQEASAQWEDRALFVHRARWNDGRWNKNTREQEKYKGCAVRSQRWRLVNNTELYDIPADPGQKNNVADKHPEVVRELSAAYDAWWDTLTPYLQNEDLPWVKEGDFHMQKRYRAQLKEKGIPDWAPDALEPLESSTGKKKAHKPAVVSPSLAEDPSLLGLMGQEKKQHGASHKPWKGKTPEQLRQWARKNLHFKLIGKRLIRDEENPEWAWFRKSGLGIFLHWGLASVPPANGDAWAMVWNEHRSKKNLLKLPEDMFAAADTWNPDKYDPGKWMAAASKAGFGYAVLTTRHHDGYCLWPSKHGSWDTGEKMNGRDLVRDYVEACRANNIRVGFYYSGPNWHSYYKLKDFSHPPVGYNYRHEKVGKEAGLVPLMGGGRLPAELAEKEHAESHGQVTELLTDYGKIDMLWWDGNSIMQEKEVHSLQPNTFVARGNIATPEGLHQGASHNVKVSNEAGWWWEMCAKAENHHSANWHYNPRNEDPNIHWDSNTLLTELIRCRSLGGNLLVNITPRPNGEMMDWYYQICEEMAGWMQHSREAIHNVKLTPPLPTLDDTRNFTTVGKTGTYYSLPDAKHQITIGNIRQPASVTLLRTGTPLAYSYADRTLRLTLPEKLRTSLPDLVKIKFD